MNKDKNISTSDSISPFERIRRTNAAGFEHWSSRDFASILGYTDYRNFESVIGKALCRVSTAAIGSRTISLTSPKWLIDFPLCQCE